MTETDLTPSADTVCDTPPANRNELKSIDFKSFVKLRPGTLQLDSTLALLANGSLAEADVVPFLGCSVSARFLGYDDNVVRLRLDPPHAKLYFVDGEDVREIPATEGVFSFVAPFAPPSLTDLVSEGRDGIYLAATRS
ncbi:MAG: hypothetical protein NXI31_04300 [bacterium]|nr:hypothetical protein [bacterium]